MARIRSNKEDSEFYANVFKAVLNNVYKITRNLLWEKLLRVCIVTDRSNTESQGFIMQLENSYVISGCGVHDRISV